MSEGEETLPLQFGYGAVGHRAHVQGKSTAVRHQLAEMAYQLAVAEVVLRRLVAVISETTTYAATFRPRSHGVEYG